MAELEGNMLIDGIVYKVNILILLLEKEVDVTIQTIETLIEGLEDGVVISVLLNGGKNKKLKKTLSTVSCISYYESNKNLGVAGGRNFLFGTEECKNSDIIMILDNDVIPPLDYVRNLSTFLIRQKDAGIAGPLIADINYSSYKVIKHFGDIGVFENRILKIRCKDVKEYLLQRGLEPVQLYHIGMYPDYHYAYFSLRPVFYSIISYLIRLLGVKRSFNPALKWNTLYLEFIKNGLDRYRVSNVGGGSQAFRRKLLNEIGCLNEMFNPYGFEDVDFSIRAIKAGYKNYIDTNTLLYHGTDSRNIERDPDQYINNIYRGLTILASRVYPNPFKYKLVIVKLIIFNFMIELIKVRFKAFSNVKARLGGFLIGINSVSENINRHVKKSNKPLKN